MEVCYVIPVVVLVFVIFLLSAYIYGQQPFSLFRTYDIPGPKPHAFIGNLDSIAKSRYIAEKEWQETYGKVAGYYFGRNAYLMISDLEIIKNIMSTNFANFRNRPFDIPTDDFTGLFLMNTKDNHWKFLRSVMMTAFSNKKLRDIRTQTGGAFFIFTKQGYDNFTYLSSLGKKMKEMNLGLMRRCMRQLLDSISIMASTGEDFCVNHYFSNYTMDIIAATGFGIEIDSQKNKSHPFVVHAKALFRMSFVKYFIAATLIFPFLWPLVNLCIIVFGERKHRDFFANVCWQTILYRRQNPDIVHNKDILQTMLEAQANENTTGLTEGFEHLGIKKALSDKQIIAQSTMFLLAAYENTANALGFLAYQLALNAEIQDRVYEELGNILGESETTFDHLQKLKYLDMCLSETLRLYPVSPRTDRIVAEDTVIHGWTFPKGVNVVFPIYTIHHDPEYWPEPEKFDPERFSFENSEGRHPYSYLPFGGGPRLCMGSRFAQLELKLAIVEILRCYRLLPCERTEIPVQLTENFLLRPKNGIWLKVEPRDR